jgi:lipid-A-disaccharide synthase
MPAADGRLIMLSAGEASGDLHGATMCRALRALDPSVRLIGMGGPLMAAAGVEILVDPTAHAAVGTSEAIGRVPGLYRAYRILAKRLCAGRPAGLVLIDFPEFNLRLARRARRAGIPVVYFIPPQLWAWRGGRIRQMARRVTRVLAVFPFEQGLYEGAGVPVEFVGHPLLDVVPSDLGREEARARLGVPERQTLVGLLPGSRRQEIARLLPPMLDAAALLAQARPGRRFVLGLAASVNREHVRAQIARGAGAGGPPVEVVEGLTHEVMAGADALLIASGTATLEAALLGTPMVVCYRVSRLTEAVVRLLNRSPWISLPNLVAGRGAVPEILQKDVTGARLAAEAERLLVDARVASAQRAAFTEVRSKLGQPGVGERAAAAVLKLVGAAP